MVTERNRIVANSNDIGTDICTYSRCTCGVACTCIVCCVFGSGGTLLEYILFVGFDMGFRLYTGYACCGVRYTTIRLIIDRQDNIQDYIWNFDKGNV